MIVENESAACLFIPYSVLKVDGIVNQLWKMLSTIFWVAVAGTMFTVSIVSNFGLLQLSLAVLFINYNVVWESKHEN